MRVSPCPCTKSVTRFQAAACSSFQSPGHPGVMRASGATAVISVSSRPAPPSARLPRCTRWKAPGTPSWLEYSSVGDTTTRFFRVMPRTVYGVSRGGQGRPPSAAGTPARCASQRS